MVVRMVVIMLIQTVSSLSFIVYHILHVICPECVQGKQVSANDEEEGMVLILK